VQVTTVAQPFIKQKKINKKKITTLFNYSFSSVVASSEFT